MSPNVHHQRGQLRTCLRNIYRTNAGKIRCPGRDSNPRHPDLMKGTLTTELPRQPQWGESNISYKGNIDYQTFAPRPLALGITSVGRQDACSSDRMFLQTIQMYATLRVDLSDDEHLVRKMLCYVQMSPTFVMLYKLTIFCQQLSLALRRF